MKRATGAKVRIGTSGYQYDHWRSLFYPEALPKKRWFAHYAEHFDTVEINNTFYGLPSAKAFAAWRERAPKDFLYALKFSRYGSHLRRLQDPQATVGRFLQRARLLGPHLGPILLQLPPNWHRDPERLDAFLAVVPSQLRWAVELRDPEWLGEETYEVLRRRRAALCLHDMIANHPQVITCDWVYLRYHGIDYTGDYSHEYLAAQADLIKDYLAAGLDVFAYFNNDVGCHAVHNAEELRRCLGG